MPIKYIINPLAPLLDAVGTSGGGSGTVTSISQGTGITLTPNPITTTGTVAVDAELAGVDAIAGTGIVVRTAVATYATRTVVDAGSGRISVVNPGGVAGNVTLDVVESALLLQNLGGVLTIAKGGTGQTTALTAFNALSPLTTRGDLLTRDATNNVRLAVGASARILQSNGTDPSWVAVSGDATIAAGGALTLASIIVAGGPTGSATVAPIITWDAKGRLTVVSSATITPAASSITGGQALTEVDDTNVTLTLGGTPATALLKAVSLTLGWTGQLSIARGGTGQSTALAAFNALSPLTTRGDLLTRDASNNVRLAIGAANTVLGSNGTDPAWVAAGATGGGLPASTVNQLLRATGTNTWAATSVGTLDSAGSFTAVGPTQSLGTDGAGTTLTIHGNANSTILSTGGAGGMLYGSTLAAGQLLLYGDNQGVPSNYKNSTMEGYVRLPISGLNIVSDSAVTMKGVTPMVLIGGRNTTLTLTTGTSGVSPYDDPEFLGLTSDDSQTLIFAANSRATEAFWWAVTAQILTMNAAAVTRTIGPVNGFGLALTLRADTGTLALSTVASLFSSPNFDRVNAGTGTLSNSVNAVYAAGAVQTGWTIPDWNGLNMLRPTIVGSGAITRCTAVNIADLATAGITTARSIISVGASTYMTHAGPVRIGDATAPTSKLEVLGNTTPDVLFAHSGSLTAAQIGLSIYNTGLTFAGTNAQATGIDCDSRWTFTANGNVANGMGQFFNFHPIITNNATARTVYGVASYATSPTFQADTAALTIGAAVFIFPAYSGVLSYPNFTSINSATGSTIGTVAGVFVGGSLGAGWTGTTLVGLSMSNWAVTGTATDQVAVDVAALTSATNNIAVRSAITAGANRYFLKDTGGAQSSLAGKFTTYNNIATAAFGVPAIVDRQGLTNQSADIADTNFTNAGVAGEYRVSVYLLTTTSAVGAGTVTCTIKWNDGTTAVADAAAAIALTSTGTIGTAIGTATIFVRLASGNITYGTSHTGIFSTAKYALYVTCERLN